VVEEGWREEAQWAHHRQPSAPAPSAAAAGPAALFPAPGRRCRNCLRPPSRTPATARGMVGVGRSGGDGAAHQRYEVTLTATALQFSTRSEMIDLRVLGPCFGWTNRPDPRAVTATIPDDLWV
jgi:hypothetical protein